MSKPIEPVKPVGMEIVFFYPCPACKKEIGLLSPTQPAMAQCEYCKEVFPIIPVNDRNIQYIRLMMNNGRSAIELDFL